MDMIDQIGFSILDYRLGHSIDGGWFLARPWTEQGEKPTAKIQSAARRPMKRKYRWFHAWILGAGLALPGAAQAGDGCCGCGRPWFHIDNCATVPPGAQPVLAGTYIDNFIRIQEGKAEQDDFVIYRHMWFKGGNELGPLGRYQLDLITKRLEKDPFPIVIETSKNDAVDEARREVIVTQLAARGFTDPTRVIVAFPIAEGLYGDEAPIIYINMITMRRSYGGGFGNDFYGGFGGYGGLGGFGGFGGFGGLGGFGLGGLGRGGFGGF
jgi:hypothetical protein